MRSLSSLLLAGALGLLFALPVQAQHSRHRQSHFHLPRMHASSARSRTVHVHGYTRHTRTGKAVHVHAYNRTRPHHH